MKHFLPILFFGFVGAIVTLNSCKQDEPAVDLSASGFPNAVGKIILGKCATAGCHNTQSKDAAGGLDMTTWDKLFEGGGGEACVIPYRPDYSTLCYYTNTFPELGVTLVPTMPFNKTSLTKEDVTILMDWVAIGAPNRQGQVKFADNPNRKKIYITNQGCDEVAVIDAETKLIMRYIHVGNTPSTESPHMVKVSPDGNNWYVISLTGTSIQKFRTSDDSYVGEINIGNPIAGWNTFSISANSQYAFISDWKTGISQIVCVDLINMNSITSYTSGVPGFIDYAHGTAINGNTLYNGNTNGNFIYNIDVSTPTSPIVNSVAIDGSGFPNFSPNLGIHDLLLSPDGTKLFITCSIENTVRIIQTSNDSLLAVIPTGSVPLEMAVSTTMPYCFVTCEDDSLLFPGLGKRGCVTVFNYQTNQFVTNIDAGTFQPHGIAIDDANGFVYVASRNLNFAGPAPHHTSSCGGRNGYITIIDKVTLEKLDDFKTEMSVDPYSIAIRN